MGEHWWALKDRPKDKYDSDEDDALNDFTYEFLQTQKNENSVVFFASAQSGILETKSIEKTDELIKEIINQ